MHKIQKISFFAALFILIPTLSFAAITKDTADNQIKAFVAPHVFEKAKKNNNWKLAFATAKHAQVVFMNITPATNPNNEVGMETHKFDQVIFVIEGKAKTILNGKVSTAMEGDMIFIPQGTPHNVINMNANKPLKILSIYSSTDIPAHTIYKKKSDTPE